MNEIKRQLDLKMGDTKERAQSVMKKFEHNKQTKRSPKKLWMPYVISVAGIVLACFLLFLLYPQLEQNQITGNPTSTNEPPIEDEMPVTLANYFPKSEETMYYAGEGNEFASMQITTTWLSDQYVQQIIDNGGGITQQIYRITNNEIQLVYNEMMEFEPVSFELDELNALETISTILKAPIKSGTKFDHKTVQYPVKVKVPFGTFEDAVLVSEETEMDTMNYYYVEQYGLVKREFITEDGYVVTSSLASIGEPPNQTTEGISTSFDEREQMARYLETGDETYLVGVSPEMILKTYVFTIDVDGSKSPEIQALALEQFDIQWQYDLAYHEDKFEEMLQHVQASIYQGKGHMHIKGWDIPFITVEFERVNDVWKITKIE